jgi:hypothetical protein
MNTFDSSSCSGTINYLSPRDIMINCTFKENIENNTIQYIASAPPDYKSSFSGSGIPYHNKEQAYFLTPNKGEKKLFNNKCDISIFKPNSYYSSFNKLELPYIKIFYNSKSFKIDLQSEKIPYRSLTHPTLREKQEQNFYNRQYKVRTQEQILIDSQYSQYEDKNFWGGKPPL